MTGKNSERPDVSWSIYNYIIQNSELLSLDFFKSANGLNQSFTAIQSPYSLAVFFTVVIIKYIYTYGRHQHSLCPCLRCPHRAHRHQLKSHPCRVCPRRRQTSVHSSRPYWTALCLVRGHPYSPWTCSSTPGRPALFVSKIKWTASVYLTYIFFTECDHYL